MPHEIGIGVATCTPIPFRRLASGQFALENITPQWHRAAMVLQFPTNCNRTEAMADGLEVGVARDKVCRELLASKRPPEFIFFHDYDVIPAGDAAIKLIYRARCYPDIDVFAGVYCCKYMSVPDPLIYREPGAGPYWDWAVGDLLTTKQHGIRGIHMGMTLIRTSYLRRMLEQGVVNDAVPFFKTVVEPGRRGTEDIWFCELGRKTDPSLQIMVDTSVLCSHQDRETGAIYGLIDSCPPLVKARWLKRRDASKPITEDRQEADENTAECPDCKGDGTIVSNGGLRVDPCSQCDSSGRIPKPLLLAIDLGFGGYKREWGGYKVYTLDARKECEPDYCQDVLKMNLPDGHFDLVASSHTFEHIGRSDQEQLWAEAFRICKPGGKLDVVVPNIEWAAAKIIAGETDEHTFNVLYGAQEEHGYKREFNTHFMGFTPEIARALAEQAGFVDVVTKDWKDDPNLGYNLVIHAVRPILAPVTPNAFETPNPFMGQKGKGWPGGWSEEREKNGSVDSVPDNVQKKAEEWSCYQWGTAVEAARQMRAAQEVANALRAGRTDEELAVGTGEVKSAVVDE